MRVLVETLKTDSEGKRIKGGFKMDKEHIERVKRKVREGVAPILPKDR